MCIIWIKNKNNVGLQKKKKNEWHNFLPNMIFHFSINMTWICSWQVLWFTLYDFFFSLNEKPIGISSHKAHIDTHLYYTHLTISRLFQHFWKVPESRGWHFWYIYTFKSPTVLQLREALLYCRHDKRFPLCSVSWLQSNYSFQADRFVRLDKLSVFSYRPITICPWSTCLSFLWFVQLFQ